MFLDKIETFSEETSKLKKIYLSKCGLCKGTGLVNSEKGYSNCDCVKRASINARLISNGLPRRYIDSKFSDLESVLDTNAINMIKDYCENIEQYIWDGFSLFLNGINKNTIMLVESIIANNLAYKKNDNGFFYNILITSTEELMQTHHASKNNYEVRNKFNKIINSVDVLFINYLGEEIDNRNDATSKFINDLLTKRTFDSKVTIISSSLDMEAIANKYGINFITTIKQNYKPVRLSKTENTMKVGEEDNGYY